MGLKHFVKKYTQGVKQSVSTIKAPIKGVIHDPQRLLTGAIDPLGTKISNTVTGQHQAPIVNQLGGPTKTTLNDVGANSLARGGFKVADIVAGAWGGAGAANGLGNAAAANGVNVGFGNSAGATALRNGATIPTGPTTGELMSAGPGGDTALSPVTLGSNTVHVGSATAPAVAGGTAPAAGGSGVSNFLGNYGQYLGPLISAGGQIAGAHANAKSAQDALDEVKRQYNQDRADNQPWLTTGTGANNRLRAIFGIGPNGESIAPDMSQFITSPDYQFNLDQNLKSVENSAAAHGGLYSGNALKAIQDRGANVASGEFGNSINRLLALAGMGQTATASNVASGDSSATNVANLLRSQGDARASGIVGAANEFGNAFDRNSGRYDARRYGYPSYRGP